MMNRDNNHRESRELETASRLSDWYRENRRDLPFREGRDPYRIWVSEIMAQQTRMEAVIPYYDRFMDRFPSLQDLAEAPEERVLEALVGKTASPATRDSFRRKLRDGELDDREIEVEVTDASSAMPGFEIPGMPGGVGMINIGDMLQKAMGGQRTRTRKTTVKESYGLLINDESDKLLDQDEVVARALASTQNDGIVFLDEIDKVAARSDISGGPSREGVQRDLLPLVEGTTVATKYGPIKTDHILFIASGAFHVSKPSDLLPELQGRLPIRVELRALEKDDFKRILTETEASLIKQYIALMETEGVTLDFTDDAIDRLAGIAVDLNATVENIGARRLQTVMERVLDDISFNAPDKGGSTVTIDAEFVDKNVGDLAKNTDLSRFIL